MITKKIQELAATRAKLAGLEKAIAVQLKRELSALPAKFGFDNVGDFVKAVEAAGGKLAGSKSAKASSGGKKRRKRSVITDATRAQVKKLVEAGKTGGEIAKAVDISLPSVHNIKKALGLVKKR
jgi:hypothetical protein